MHSGNLDIEGITKIEGAAGLKVTVADDKVTDLKFIIADYRRFYTEAVKGKSLNAIPPFLSRICGTCSIAHLFASIEAIERSQDTPVSEQTMLLRRLVYDSFMIRDHALHLYFFVLPDVLGLDSILEIPDNPKDLGHILLHDSFEIKKVGTDLATAIAGAAIHAPYPTIGGFLKLPDDKIFPDFSRKLEDLRPRVLRAIKFFADWKEELIRNSDYLCLQHLNRYDFIQGEIVNSNGKRVAEEGFRDFLRTVVIPYSQSEGYIFSDTYEDYLVGALARMNLNKARLNPRTEKDTAPYLNFFPSNNIYHNNLAQAIEVLQCIDDAIEIMKNIHLTFERPPFKLPKAGVGVGVVEAPRGTLYHKIEVNNEGQVANYDVIVPTSQNQISIGNDLKKYFNENLDKDENLLKHEAEKIIRAYDPCMSCATNFLKIDWSRK